MKRSPLRVQAFQVTMTTPSGCKKFELGTDKNLLEVRQLALSLPLLPLIIIIHHHKTTYCWLASWAHSTQVSIDQPHLSGCVRADTPPPPLPPPAVCENPQGALAAGVEVPNLCRTGTCGACASRLVSGDVQRDDFLLDDQQKEAGFLLLCTTTPTSDIELLSHQETEMHTVPYGL